MTADIKTNYKQSETTEKVEVKTTAIQGDEIEITFRQNRKYDLRIGRDVYTFYGQETKKFSRKLLFHADWTPETASYFSIKGDK